MSGLFHLPLAGLVAALVAWAILEPGMQDFAIICGPVALINTDPFEAKDSRAVVYTVGDKEVWVVLGQVRLEPGVDGQAPFESILDIHPGTVLEVVGEPSPGSPENVRLAAMSIRPATGERARRIGTEIQGEANWAAILFFPLTAVLIAVALLVAEGISSRNWQRMLERLLLGALLTAVFAFLSYFPAGLVIVIGHAILMGAMEGVFTVQDLSAIPLLFFIACRSTAWAVMGAALGLGMNLTRSTRVQLRNSVIGGALGGALGGLFFDPINRFAGPDSCFVGAEVSRMVGLAAVGISVGIFVALVDRLAREAWVLVKTGPLAGKSFVLYRTPTRVGSEPRADIYLFKDAAIAPVHATIHRVGNQYEIEDMDSPQGTVVGGRPVRRHRLSTGDRIVLGSTVLEFEERTRRSRTGLPEE